MRGADALTGLLVMRIAYRMLYEHMRAHISGSARETRRALILGAGHAARLLIAGIQHQGWWWARWTTTLPSGPPAWLRWVDSGQARCGGEGRR